MSYSRECAGCGTTFETANFKQSRCKRGCGSKNKARDIRTLNNDIEFVGVDGEGVDRPNGDHDYVMLSVGERTLWRDGRQLQLEEILSFLWQCYTEKPDAAFVGFFLGYDFIQWLKLLPEDRAWLLFHKAGIAKRTSKRSSRANPYPDPVVYGEWEIDILAGRRFKFRPHVHHRSEFNDSCRNRTCRKVLGDSNFAPADGPAEIIAGEMDFEPVDEGIDYEGDVVRFWKVLAPYRHHMVGRNERVAKTGTMYICDTGPFWQTSFLNVINPKQWGELPVCSEGEYQTVLEGKNNRSQTHAVESVDYYQDMVRYNILENELLARVTKRLNQGFMNERVPIRIHKKDWYGPGRAAQLWIDMLHRECADKDAVEWNKEAGINNARIENARMERRNETGLLNADVYMSMPTWFYEAAQASYYGGWFEQFMHGHIGNVMEYDINSAYPHIIASLPCLHTTGIHNGTYTRGDGSNYPTDRGSYTLLYCTVQGSNPHIGAMPHRNHKGLISRPHITKGWYWLHEITASQSARLVDSVSIEQWVSYKPCTCTPPFNPSSIGITSLYQLRLDFGKNTPQGKSAKLVYNSAYGKTAQSIGQPKYSNPVYASLITAGCRTLILDSIATHPLGATGVSMVATDGVYFTTPHPTLNLNSTRLGAWDQSEKHNLTQLMPGVYWDDKTRERVRDGLSAQLKSRGVSGRDLAKEIGRLDLLFESGLAALENGESFTWPEIKFSVGFLLTGTKAAMARGKWGTAGQVQHGTTRSISANPFTKRDPIPYLDGRIIRTRPYQLIDSTIETTPYSKAFGYMEDEEEMFPGMVGRDGEDPMAYWKELIND